MTEFVHTWSHEEEPINEAGEAFYIRPLCAEIWTRLHLVKILPFFNSTKYSRGEKCSFFYTNIFLYGPARRWRLPALYCINPGGKRQPI
jgi:hypothetical protein